jgi:hypothetical protein
VRVAKVQIVPAFEDDPELPLTIGLGLRTLTRVIGGSVLTVPIPPDAPPNMSRLVLQAENLVLQVALNRLDLAVMFEDGSEHRYSTVVDNVADVAARVFSVVQQYLPPHRWLGVVAEIEFPTEARGGAGEAVKPLFERVVTVPLGDRPLNSFKLQFGVKEGDFNVTYTVGGYEMFRVHVPPGAGSFMIDRTATPPSQCGIQVLLDVNNRPGGGGTLQDDLERIFDKHRELFARLSVDLKLGGLVEIEE